LLLLEWYAQLVISAIGCRPKAGQIEGVKEESLVALLFDVCAVCVHATFFVFGNKELGFGSRLGQSPIALKSKAKARCLLVHVILLLINTPTHATHSSIGTPTVLFRARNIPSSTTKRYVTKNEVSSEMKYSAHHIP
jgi:hypothetical protein